MRWRRIGHSPMGWRVHRILTHRRRRRAMVRWSIGRVHAFISSWRRRWMRGRTNRCGRIVSSTRHIPSRSSTSFCHLILCSMSCCGQYIQAATVLSVVASRDSCSLSDRVDSPMGMVGIGYIARLHTTMFAPSKLTVIRFGSFCFSSFIRYSR